ncbi:MAG: adenylate/guanylate cyclase domain-containing protein [Thermoleophilaceae bacterium]|nr:adenylate/guanylate cyclase domain-containing protein [Thermoleophilaceae bacterium]
MSATRERLRRRRLAMIVFVAAASAAIGIVLWATDALQGPELDLVDARFSVRGERERPRELVVVEIDDRTFDDLRRAFPFPRSVHAQLIDILREAGARAIAYDIQFTEPTVRSEDRALVEAIARHGNVVLATTEVTPQGGTNVLGGEDVLARIGARAANAIFIPDGDGVIRRVPAAIDGLTTFSLAAAEAFRGEPVDVSRFDGGAALIDYVGPPGTMDAISFSRVLDGDFPRRLFENKAVIVGASAPTLQDVHPTSVAGGELMGGAEIQANAIATILGGLPLQYAPGWLDVALIVLMACVAPAASMRLAPLGSLGVALAVAALFAIGAQLAFEAGIVVAVIYPLVALAMATVAALAVSYFTATLERERVRDIFSRFVPEAVVDDVLADAGEDLRLGGVERECTVMFTDLRGFTSFSESLPPDQVIEVVNAYLGEMSEAILDSGGTLIAYMGDGIMALFGAPIAHPDHADRALAAAREMMGRRLERFNAWLHDARLGDGLRMGIGLNTGKVMAGNVGSAQRLEYTAIGDTTNTASRLEGLTKNGGYMLLIAESTKAALTRPPGDLVYVDEFDVRGRAAKLRAWSVPDPAGAPRPAQPEA